MLGAREGAVKHLVIAVVMAFVVGSVARANAVADAWDERETGLKRAAAVIAECLGREASRPPNGAEPCVHIVFQTCEKEHGTSQHDLNDCAYVSRFAWEARLNALRSQLLSAKVHPDGNEDPEPMKRLFRAADRQWIEWNKADCEMQVARDGGSMLPMVTHLCFSRHAALRTLELEDMKFWWAKAFDLPD